MLSRLQKFADIMRRLAKDNSGVTAIEYVILAAGTAVLIAVAWTALGVSTSNMFATVSSAFSDTETAAVDSSDDNGSSSSSSDNDDDSDFASDDDSESSDSDDDS